MPGELEAITVVGSLECKVLQDGESGQDGQQGLAPKSYLLGGHCGLCMERLAADCSTRGAPRSGMSRESPALRGHRAWGECGPGVLVLHVLGSAVRRAWGILVVGLGQLGRAAVSRAFLPC